MTSGEQQAGADSSIAYIGGKERRALNFGQGKRCRRVRVQVTIPTKNTGGSGSQDITGTIVLNILRQIFASIVVTFGFGEKPQRWIDGLNFDRLREFFVLLDEDDYTVIKSDGTVLEAPTSTVIANVADTATYNVVCEIPLPFEFARADAADRGKWNPGTTQMRAMKMEILRGTGFDASAKVGTYFEQNGAVTFKLLADTRVGEDVWTEPPRLFNRTVADQGEEFSPGGALLAVYDRTGLAAASSISEFSILAHTDDGKEEAVHQNIIPTDISRNADREIEENRTNLADLATILYRHPLDAPIEEAPHGRRFSFRQLRQTPVTTDLVFCYAPPVEHDTEDVIAEHMTHPSAGNNLPNLKLVRETPDHATSPVAPVTAGLRIVRPGGTDYPGAIGNIITKHSDGTTTKRADLPAAAVNAAESVANAGRDKAEKAATAAKVTVGLARKLPGKVTISRSVKAVAQGSGGATIAAALPGVASLFR